jgi:hypothetical protein
MDARILGGGAILDVRGVVELAAGGELPILDCQRDVVPLVGERVVGDQAVLVGVVDDVEPSPA